MSVIVPAGRTTRDRSVAELQLCQAAREPADTVEQAIDLVGRGVTGAAGADDAVAGLAEAGDDGGGVEVAVRDEHRLLGERARDILGAHAVHGERYGRRARLAGRRTEH